MLFEGYKLSGLVRNELISDKDIPSSWIMQIMTRKRGELPQLKCIFSDIGMLQMELKFSTDYQFIDRKTKAKYVWLKYQNILMGRILDVGADKCHLKEHLDKDTFYFGVGLGGTPDIQINLEKEKIPFEDNSFDCVLCNDVLEHLDNIHSVFDELCRVSRKWVVISLPNAWQDFYSMLNNGYYAEDRPMKFYNLPLEPPEDRHKWFFSAEEAEKFIEYRAKKKWNERCSDRYSREWWRGGRFDWACAPPVCTKIVFKICKFTQPA